MKRAAIFLLALSVMMLTMPHGAADPSGEDNEPMKVKFDFVKKTGETGGGYSIMYNPTELSIKKTVPWKEDKKTGEPKTSMTNGANTKLLLDVTFDTSEFGGDVSTFTNAIEERVVEDPVTEEPVPFKVVLDDKWVYTCVLEKATTEFKIFKPDGIPVRATVSCTFSEFLPEKPRVKGE